MTHSHRRPFRRRLARHDYDDTVFFAYQTIGALIGDVPDLDPRILDNLAALLNARKPPHGWGALRAGTQANYAAFARVLPKGDADA